MDNTSHNDLLKEYYLSNKGILFKSFEIKINNFFYKYDIYWGDPKIIFDTKTLIKSFPLAVTTIPHKYNYSNPRIFLHEKFEKINSNVFESVIAHEIGHLWLHDIHGFNNLNTNIFMEDNESEIWADYFSYSYFVKYRNITCLEDFIKILAEASKLQVKIYCIDSKQYMEFSFAKRAENLKLKDEQISSEYKNRNQIIIQMKNGIEITLNALGDIFH